MSDLKDRVRAATGDGEQPELAELLQADDDLDDQTSAPPVIRGTVIARDDQDGEQRTPAGWPAAAQPGSGIRDEAGDGAA